VSAERLRWRNVGEWQALSPGDLGALPVEAVRTYDLDGVLVSVVKQEDGSFRLLSRIVPTQHLHGRASVERVRLPDGSA
jgi:hypothetical protein